MPSARSSVSLAALALTLLAVVGCATAAPSVLPGRPPATADARPFSVHDMLAMQRVAMPEVSPDGRWVVFGLRSTDVEANKGLWDLWLVGTDGKGLRRLTTHKATDLMPHWSKDGLVHFLSSRSGSMQVWRIDPRGGESSQVTSFETGVEDFRVHPDGRRYLLALETYPDCPDLACTEKRDEERAARKATGRLYDKLLYRHWDTWKDGKRRHVFAWTLGEAAPRDLMAGLDTDSPTKPWGGMEEVVFSPDGKEVVYTARKVGRDEAWSVDFNLYRVPWAGGERSCLTCANEAWDTFPAFSPDGKTLAYLAMARPGFEADRLRVQLLSWPSGKKKAVPAAVESWDRSPRGVVWAPDGKALYANADNLGQTSIFALDLAKGGVKTLVHEGNNATPMVAGDRLVFGQNSLMSPTELWSIPLSGGTPSAVTRINHDRVARTKMGRPTQFTFKGAHGDTVYGYVIEPVDFSPGKRYPVAFLVHGGPQGSFGNFFHYRWNPQAYTGAGYAVVMIDFHGSTGYGQKFQDAIRHDWGGAPYEDLMKGLDHALKSYPYLDGDKVCALGASYGGYMINWMAGQTQRFRCFVNHDGNLDERMAYFDTEELWFPEWEHGGTPWDNPAGYSKHNPIDHVGKWKTPMLVIHGALDYRVVDTQGMSTFTALQRQGIPSQFLYFPDENHWVLKPQNSIQWHDTVLAWMKRWLSPGPAKR